MGFCSALSTLLLSANKPSFGLYRSRWRIILFHLRPCLLHHWGKSWKRFKWRLLHSKPFGLSCSWRQTLHLQSLISLRWGLQSLEQSRYFRTGYGRKNWFLELNRNQESIRPRSCCSDRAADDRKNSNHAGTWLARVETKKAFSSFAKIWNFAKFD